MDPILAEVYATVLPAAPYVFAAVGGSWVALFVYVLVLSRRSRRTAQDVAALTEALRNREQREER